MPSAYEASIQAPCDTSATFLHTNPRRLFVESSPFLSELAQQDMDKALSIHDNVYRWPSRL